MFYLLGCICIYGMFRYHLPHHRSINIVIITITVDIAQPVFKAKDTALFTARCVLGCFSMKDDGAGIIGC
jgi:hypothetical protein